MTELKLTLCAFANISSGHYILRPTFAPRPTLYAAESDFEVASPFRYSGQVPHQCRSSPRGPALWDSEAKALPPDLRARHCR